MVLNETLVSFSAKGCWHSSLHSAITLELLPNTCKNRIRAGKELLEAKRIDEENERKRMLAYWESEKEEQKRAREKLLKKLMEDKAERRSKLGLPPENPASVKTSLPVVLEKNSLFTKLDTKAEPLRECLRFLKKSHKSEKGLPNSSDLYQNVAKHPDEEKFRKIRFSNPAFQRAVFGRHAYLGFPLFLEIMVMAFIVFGISPREDSAVGIAWVTHGNGICGWEDPISSKTGVPTTERVGSLTGGIEFLELCGFERTEDGEFLFLPQEKVDMAVLNSAGSVLNSAMTNPSLEFFQVEKNEKFQEKIWLWMK
ncbi:hypothetical protein CK203_109282 [Vitis vinifera]|uniref:PUB domain-containing protein n=1 Tax=Vitis vinifera TaxID=29760 RepID=A0A438DAC7_VITVI|nr:hypothetical protein CK203_109282 [Vitis vinifera]